MRNRTIRGCLVIFVLFIACISATSKDVQRKPLDIQTEIHNTENKEPRSAEPPIIVNVSPPQKTHEEIEQEAKKRDERSDIDRKIVELTQDFAKYTFGLFVTAVALALATVGLGILSWRQSRDMNGIDCCRQRIRQRCNASSESRHRCGIAQDHLEQSGFWRHRRRKPCKSSPISKDRNLGHKLRENPSLPVGASDRNRGLCVASC